MFISFTDNASYMKQVAVQKEDIVKVMTTPNCSFHTRLVLKDGSNVDVKEDFEEVMKKINK